MFSCTQEEDRSRHGFYNLYNHALRCESTWQRFVLSRVGVTTVAWLVQIDTTTDLRPYGLK